MFGPCFILNVVIIILIKSHAFGLQNKEDYIISFKCYPYFFKNEVGQDVTVYGDRYSAMITDNLFPEIETRDLHDLWYQQDGATFLAARETMALWREQFGEQLILRFGPGPYEVNITKLEVCHGPKQKNLTNVHMYSSIYSNNTSVSSINLTFSQATTVDEAQVQLFRIEDGIKKFVMKHRIEKPCQHFALTIVMKKLGADRYCVVQKGTKMLALDFTEHIKIFFGDSFFFGSYYIKSNILSKKGNIFCLILAATFSPKNKST